MRYRFFAIAWLISLSTSAFAAPSLPTTEKMNIGESTILRFDHIEGIIVGDVSIADVVQLSADRLLVSARGLGYSTVKIADRSGNHFVHVKVSRSLSTEAIAERIREEIAGPSKLGGAISHWMNVGDRYDIDTDFVKQAASIDSSIADITLHTGFVSIEAKHPGKTSVIVSDGTRITHVVVCVISPGDPVLQQIAGTTAPLVDRSSSPRQLVIDPLVVRIGTPVYIVADGIILHDDTNHLLLAEPRSGGQFAIYGFAAGTGTMTIAQGGVSYNITVIVTAKTERHKPSAQDLKKALDALHAAVNGEHILLSSIDDSTIVISGTREAIGRHLKLSDAYMGEITPMSEDDPLARAINSLPDGIDVALFVTPLHAPVDPWDVPSIPGPNRHAKTGARLATHRFGVSTVRR